MTDMKVSVQAGGGLERRVTVEIPAERIEREIESRLVTVGRTAKLKGFRPGKVPPRVIRERYGAQVRQEVLQELIQSSYSSAIEQEDLRPAAMPAIEPGNMAEGQDFSYTAVFEIYPEIEVKGLEVMSVEQPRTVVTDDDLDEMIETLRRQRADFAAVDRAAADGDRVTIDFEGRRGGEPFEGGAGQDVPIVIGEGRMIPGFEANLVGCVAGDEKTFEVQFPVDYHVSELAGQPVEFSATVKEIAEQQLPEIDDEFLRGFGIDDGDMARFRADVRGNMEREAAGRNRAEVKRQIMEQLLDANAIDVPAALTEREAANLRAETLRNMGLNDENDPNAPPASEFSEAAERRVRLGLLVGAVIEDSGLEVDRERVKGKVDEIVAPYDQPDEIRKMYYQNPQLMNQVEEMVLEEQVIEWLVDKSTVTEKDVGFSELMESR